MREFSCGVIWARYRWSMKKRQLAKPKEKIIRISRNRADTLYEQYIELLRLRDEIGRLAASRTKLGQPDRS
jgi:division protein CdvB (Snf7/Vps24/ESCRT-III family)